MGRDGDSLTACTSREFPKSCGKISHLSTSVTIEGRDRSGHGGGGKTPCNKRSQVRMPRARRRASRKRGDNRIAIQEEDASRVWSGGELRDGGG